MALQAGTRLGAYEVIAAIGAGGMGEVYRARDTRLGRDVAIKTLPELTAGDPERLARLDREAQLLAALNHPHIGAIYGLEDSPSGKFLVLELVDGESLAERLARDGTLPVAEALRIATQIIDALEAAHDKGIIHRDLKPGNIMLTADGQVKVLDFGLARAMEAASPSGVSNSPTLSLAATQAGMILGTAAYMSPEQAKGRVADKRSDVWAFGCVLYEMLTGKRAFEGEDVSDTLASILKGEPDWSAIPADVPGNIRTILRRCLTRDRKGRIPDISVVRYLLLEPATPPAMASTAPAGASRRRLAAGIALGVLAGAALSGAAAGALMRWRTPPPPQPMRFEFTPSRPLVITPTDRTVAITQDASHIAYVSGESAQASQLSVRRVDRLDAVPLAGTSNARFPFFSPDGRWIAFFAAGELKKVPVSGGPVMTVCRITGTPRGGTWTDSNQIVFATASPISGLLTVPSSGGEPKVLTKPEGTGSVDHFFPAALPGGRAVVYTVVAPSMADSAQLAVVDLATGEQRILLPGGSHAEYLHSGHLVYGFAGTLRAVRFDLARLTVSGEPLAVEPGVLTMSATGAANFALSRDGHLVFVPGGEADGLAARTLVWVNRKGQEEPIAAPARAYIQARVSPEGTRVALAIRDQEQDIWVWDLARKTPTKISFGPAADASPLWMPDGRRVIFQSARDGAPNLYVQAADGTGTTERLTTSANLHAPSSISRDGTTLLMAEVDPQHGPDVHLLRLDGKSKPQPIIQTQYAELLGELSPDGRYLAYQSNESGAPNIYVKPFPDINAGRWHISPAGGVRPVWARHGRELFYAETNGAIMAVPVETTGTFRHGNPVKLFDSRQYFAAVPGRPFDVGLDGRFLMIKEPSLSDAAQRGSLVFVHNWVEELKAKVPAK